MKRFYGWSSMVLAALALLPSAAWAAGNAANGEALTRVWCANCHVTDSSNSGRDSAPSLSEVAQRGTPDQMRARIFLSSPHPPMPNFNLARQQIDDIVAYLKTLAHR
jgi:mono/diheme cytochrome c family protein